MARAGPLPSCAPKASEWPDLSDAALATTIEEWLAPHLVGKAGLADIGPDDLERGSARASALAPAAAARRRRRRPMSRCRPARGSRSITAAGRGRCSPCACRNSSGSTSIRASRAAGSRSSCTSLAGPTPDPDHPGPAGILARLLGGRARRACADDIRSIPGRRIRFLLAPRPPGAAAAGRSRAARLKDWRVICIGSRCGAFEPEARSAHAAWGGTVSAYLDLAPEGPVMTTSWYEAARLAVARFSAIGMS